MEKVFLFTTINISIHAPREGGDKKVGLIRHSQRIFQSTPPREGGDQPVLGRN